MSTLHDSTVELAVHPFPTPGIADLSKLSSALQARHDQAVLARWERLVLSNLARRIKNQLKAQLLADETYELPPRPF